MDNFYRQVESLLVAKSKAELRTFIIRAAELIPETEQREFLEILENKNVVISKAGKRNIDTKSVIKRISHLLENVEEYEVEAYYYDNWDDEGYNIESDGGFSKEFYACYCDAVKLLEHEHYEESAKAFDMLDQTIEAFDNYNECNDYCAVSVEILISERMLDVDMIKFNSLLAYSALMAKNVNDDKLFGKIYRILRGCEGKITFNDLLCAGSEPVQDVDILLEDWISYLYMKPASQASSLVRDAALLSGRDESEIMERYVREVGMHEPKSYIDLCELYIELGHVGKEKIVSIAVEGLDNTENGAKNRDDLAKLLACFAKETNNQDAYIYAITECFYSTSRLENYLPIHELGDKENIAKAVRFFDNKINPGLLRYPSSDDKDYFAIHFLNQDYDLVFDAVAADNEALGWSNSIKGLVIPLFIGLLSGFDEHSLVIQKLISGALYLKNNDLLFKCLHDSKGSYTEEQEKKWYARCISEAEKRTDAIVSRQLRGSYYKAARLLVAVAEMRFSRNEGAPFSIIHKFIEKYPRHSAFRGELRTALANTGLTELKV